MKIVSSWKRNMPDTLSGESITVTIVYKSFDKDEIDLMESQMKRGVTISEIDVKEAIKCSNASTAENKR